MVSGTSPRSWFVKREGGWAGGCPARSRDGTDPPKHVGTRMGGMHIRREASASEQRLPVGREVGSPPLTWHQGSRGSKELVRAGSLRSPSVELSPAGVCPALSRSLSEKPPGIRADP